MSAWPGKILYYVHGTEVSSGQVVRETPHRLVLASKTIFSSQDAHKGHWIDKPTSGFVEGETDDPYRTGRKAWPRYKGWIATDRDVAIAQALASHRRDIAHWRDQITKVEALVSALEALRTEDP